ncbi:MAG: transposase [Candidatus Woesearchaeota archaeon]
MRTHRFRLYPSKATEQKLQRTLDLCRFTYNQLLDEFSSWDSISRYELQSRIVDLQICYPELKEVYSKTLQYENYRLFSNLKALGETKKNGRKVGRLRFKGKGWFKTIHYNQSGYKFIMTGKRCQTLKLSKVGEIPIRCHRTIKGNIKQVVVKREPSGKWFASIITDQQKIVQKKPINKVVGIDLGLTDSVWDSDNNKTENPKFLSKYSEQLATCQRRMSKKKLGSNNREKFRIRLARRYEQLTNTRKDFVHKLTRYYADNYDAIAMEDMSIANMVKGKKNRFSKSLLDACFGLIRSEMRRKAENAGGVFIPVNFRGTTSRCSQCGNDTKKELCEREHNCYNCGFVVPRDYNSALEIKRLALIEIRQELPESTLEEMDALHSNVQLPSMSQEATSLEAW